MSERGFRDSVALASFWSIEKRVTGAGTRSSQKEQLGKLLAACPALWSNRWITSLKAWRSEEPGHERQNDKYLVVCRLLITMVRFVLHLSEKYTQGSNEKGEIGWSMHTFTTPRRQGDQRTRAWHDAGKDEMGRQETAIREQARGHVVYTFVNMQCMTENHT